MSEKLADIQYNFINLPSRIEFENGHVISYLYDADGIKLRTTHIIGSDTTVTDYCGNVIYENGIPVKLLTEAGYVTLADSKYHYFVQDHLGNNRVVVDQSGNVEEVNHYYPFGGLLSSSVSNAVQPYKYNGKELDRKNGLDWYDYGARMYDAALGTSRCSRKVPFSSMLRKRLMMEAFCTEILSSPYRWEWKSKKSSINICVEAISISRWK